MPAQSTQRFGKGRAATRYGLSAQTLPQLPWKIVSAQQQCVQASEQNTEYFEARVVLDNLRAGDILVPSFVLLSSQPYSYSISLTSGDQQWRLARVASHPTPHSGPNTDTDTDTDTDTVIGTEVLPTSTAQTSSKVTSHIDLFAIHCNLPRAELVIRLTASSAPDDYLLVTSRRPKVIDTAILSPPTKARPVHQVPALSQMVQPLAQRNRTCSPTSLAMLMAYHGAPYHPALIDACRDPATGLYGVWPLNIVQAGLRGFTGAIELVSHWERIAHYEKPFIASVCFGPGELEGAALRETDGHLVVVCGTTKTTVICNDPAAASADKVVRHYDLKAFTKAWLGSRGAAYFIDPTNSIAEYQ